MTKIDDFLLEWLVFSGFVNVGTEGSQVWHVYNAEVCGTPGYLAPEIIECSMDAGHAGYGTAVDMWVGRK